MKNALIICDLVFAIAFGGGLGAVGITDEPNIFLIFIVPLMFLTGYILVENDL